jgi:serine/threonine protein kinase
VHNAAEVSNIYKEADSMKKLRHKNIVELYHAFLEGKQLIMIMELAKGGELMEYV